MMAGRLPGSERVICSRCGANNFPGTPQCWQCQASLPPPEAAHRAAAPSGPVVYTAAPARRRLPMAAIVVMVVAAAMVVMMVLGIRRWSADRAERRLAELHAVKERLMRERGRATLNPDASGDLDPTEAQARREIRRLEQQLDQMPYGAPGGDVRLRAGGSMSTEEYERWRRQLRSGSP